MKQQQQQKSGGVYKKEKNREDELLLCCAIGFPFLLLWYIQIHLDTTSYGPLCLNRRDRDRCVSQNVSQNNTIR